MRAVRSRDTGPEIAVRKLLHGLGLRFRIHGAQFPGRPDIVLRKHRTVVFVHGCFWHGHDCPKGKLPKSRAEYWGPKLIANKDRDAAALQAISERGWRALVIWQCELRDKSALEQRLRDHFGIIAKKSIDFVEGRD